jgi:uncharacterized membrane protein YphA (DoxX/SURF4 family)
MFMSHDSVQTSPWKRAVAAAAVVFLGLVLLVAAWGKALDPEAFVEQIRYEGLAVLGNAEFVAFFALAVEIGLGLALVMGLRRWWIVLPTTLLVLFFLFLTGRAYWRFEHGLIDLTEACGCFGNLLSRSPAQAFWQDLLMLGVPLLLLALDRKGGRDRSFPTRRLALIAVLTVAGLVFAWKAPDLPLDDLATRLKPGVRVDEICAGSVGSPEYLCLDTLLTELDAGRHWVTLSNLEEASFLEAIPRLNEYVMAQPEVPFWVLTAASPEVVSAFEWTQAPAFHVQEVPEAMLRPLHRRLPRSFLVDAGRVAETVSGLPPAAF